jgi:DNA-binding SARP family transcriptional activator
VLLDDAAGNKEQVRTDPDDDASVAEAKAVLRLADPADTQPSTDAHDADDMHARPYSEAACDVEIVVLGQVDVNGVEAPLTPGELELLAYLATHRHGDSADTILTMLWPEGKALKTLRNRVSSLRSKLHTGRDGEMLVPYADDDRYRLSSLVITDGERLARRFEYAEGAPSSDAINILHGALELVGGPPFRAATGYAWAFSEGLATEFAETVKRAARRLAELYLDVGDASGALWAARRGSLVASPADNQQLTRVVMEAHTRLGNTAAALAAYRELVEDLDELDPNIDPDPEVTELYRKITGRTARRA